MKTGKMMMAGILAAAMAVAETGPFGGENVLVNSSFETGSSISSGVGYSPKVSTSAWTMGTSAGLTCPGSWCSPTTMHFPDGTRCAFIQMSSAGAFISQTFTAPQSGLYRLSFYHSARPGTILGERVRVLVDDVDYGFATDWNMDFEFSTFDIPIAAGVHTLKLKGDQNGATTDQTAVIDKVTLEIPAEPNRALGNLDNFAFRFDFSQGTKVVTGSKYADATGANAVKVEAVDGPNGSSTAAKFMSGWGSITDGDKSLNGDWTIALSCVPMSGSKQAIVCVGGNGTVDRKQLVICSETDGRMYFAIGQRWKSNGLNVPSAVTVGGLVEPDTLFHSICCVHRKESNIITCFIDGMLVGRLNAIQSCGGRTFMTGFQFNGCHGGAVSGINGGANVPMEDVRFFERALSDAEVAMYAKLYPARRPSQSPVATDVTPAEDTAYDTDPTAAGTLFVPTGVTVTAPSLAGNYFNYGKIVLTGDNAVTAAPRGPGVMRFTGTQTLQYTGLGNSPVEIAGNVTIAASSPLTYRSSPMTIESGTVTLGGQITCGDAADSDYYDPFGFVLNFLGGTFAGNGFLYTGGRSTQSDINITAGTFTARVAPYGATTSQGANRRVNVSGTGVFAPTSLAYNAGSAPGAVQRTTINLREGGTFTPPADWPAYAWLNVQYGSSKIALAGDSAPTADVEVLSEATVTVDGNGEVRTLDLLASPHSLAGSMAVTNGAALKLPVGEIIGGKLTVANDAKLQLDFTEYDGSLIALTAAGGVVVDGDVEARVEFVNAPAGYKPALGEDGTTIAITAEDLTIPVTADWIGAGEAGNLTDPANWICYNAEGTVLEGDIPDARTFVRVSGATNFQLPYDPAATLAAMDNSAAENRMATICAHIQYTQRSGMTDYSYMDIPYSAYDPLGEVPLTVLADDAWKQHYLGWSQLRFDGWFKVTAEQAGEWTLGQSFDDYYAMYFDGECVVKNLTYDKTASGTCTMTAGWHRFTLIVGDTYGGYGLSRIAGGVKTVLGVSINGAAEVPFETAFEQGTGPSQMWKKLNIGTCQLTADADWRGVASFQDGAVIDLAGHQLQVAALEGAAEITDTVGGGELHGDFNGINNTMVAFTGKLRFVKKGSGIFWASKANQSYTGGTEIRSGKMYFGTANLPAGARKSEIKIAAGAMLDMNGQVTCYNYDTAGTIRMATSTGSNGYNANFKCFGPEFKLSGDAKVTGKFFYFGSPDATPMYFTMNGHTLTLDFDDYVGIGAWRSRDAGKMVFARGWVEWLAGWGPLNVDIEVHPSAHFKLGGNFDMKGFWYGANAWSKNSGVQAHILVYGAWKATAYRPPVYLCKGASIDLNLMSEPLDLAGGDRTCASGANGYVSFDPACETCLLDVSQRNLFGSGTKVIGWTEPPANVTFALNEASKKCHYWMNVRADGVYIGRSGITILVR